VSPTHILLAGGDATVGDTVLSSLAAAGAGEHDEGTVAMAGSFPLGGIELFQGGGFEIHWVSFRSKGVPSVHGRSAQSLSLGTSRQHLILGGGAETTERWTASDRGRRGAGVAMLRPFHQIRG